MIFIKCIQINGVFMYVFERLCDGTEVCMSTVTTWGSN